MSRAVYKAVKYNLDEVIKKLQKIVECDNCQLILNIKENEIPRNIQTVAKHKQKHN
jgi:ribosomal protein L34E